MNELQIFTNKAFGSVRVVEQDGQPWFVARDVCDCLGLANITEALRALDEDELTSEILKSAMQGREMRLISESGLYSLIFRSSKPEARAFSKWVRAEVLPAIRKHGAYLTPDTIERVLEDPDTIIRLAMSLKDERARRAVLESQAERDRPKVVFADSIAVAQTSILVGEMAKLITQGTSHTIGQNRLFNWLKCNKYLHKHGSQRHMPTQYSIERGLFEIKEGTRVGSSGESHITKTTKITGKGQIYFMNLFKTLASTDLKEKAQVQA